MALSETDKFGEMCHDIHFVLAEDTATLLTDLADIETKKGTAIHAPVSLSKDREQVTSLLDKMFGQM